MFAFAVYHLSDHVGRVIETRSAKRRFLTAHVVHSCAGTANWRTARISPCRQIRTVGSVEFNGERIAYDEIIGVRIVLGTISTMGLKKGDNRVGMTRPWIARTLASGGALLMEVPNGAGRFTDFERTDGPADPRVDLFTFGDDGGEIRNDVNLNGGWTANGVFATSAVTGSETTFNLYIASGIQVAVQQGLDQLVA